VSPRLQAVQRPHAMLRRCRRVSRALGFSRDSSRVGRVGSVIRLISIRFSRISKVNRVSRVIRLT
jgi:hypothetical protein